MAARKSCTHLTWAEAKSNSGIGGSKKPLIPKKIDHGKALTAKIIAKKGASQDEISKEKTLMRRAKRGEERAAAAALIRAEEKERQRRETMVKPLDIARGQMREKADMLQKIDDDKRKGEDSGDNDGGQGQFVTGSAQQMLAECRELQVNELLGLEAIYNTDVDDGTNNEFRIVDSAEFELLQKHVDQWQVDPEDEVLLKKIAEHPLLSFTIQLCVDGVVHDGEDSELTALLLVRVTLPSLYPLGDSTVENSLPAFDIEYFCCTEREMECTPDKPLESLAYLDETRLKESLCAESKEILPDPCVYMAVTACLMERLFEFMKMSIQGRHVLEKYLSQKRSESLDG